MVSNRYYGHSCEPWWIVFEIIKEESLRYPSISENPQIDEDPHIRAIIPLPLTFFVCDFVFWEAKQKNGFTI